MNERVPFDVTYYREYGIHSVANGSSEDHLASFPDWKTTEVELKNHLPESGTVITPELITADPEHFANLPAAEDEIKRRIEFIKDLSTQTDASIYLGSPTKILDTGSALEPPSIKWHNSAIEIAGGEIRSMTHKTALLPVEQEAGISAPRSKERIMRAGRIVLICAELHSYRQLDNPLVGFATKEIVSPTSWATPMLHRVDNRSPEVKDEQYREALEHSIGAITMKKFANVERVTTVDRGTHDVAPYNAVFTRRR